jgi:uncharacterized protein DUF3631/uncharacterized protein DUF3854
VSGSAGLLDHHAALIKASAIADDVARERGYHSATVAARVRELGFSAAQARVPCLVVPIHGVAGGIVSHQIRPDKPRTDAKGKARKYDTPHKATNRLDVHPRARRHLDDPRVPLVVTEGVRKADAAVSRGLCAVAIIGPYGWRGTNGKGGKVALGDWESIALNGRDVFLVPDSDAAHNAGVFDGFERLAEFLRTRKTDVRHVVLPHSDGGAKCGLDDYFAAGHSVDDLFALATKTPRRPTTPKPKPTPPAYDGPIPTTADVLDAAREFVRRFVILSEHEYDATALWIAHSYAFDAAYATPYLLIVSPAKKSGKTRLLEVLRPIVARPWNAVSPSEAALFRKIEQDRPTLLLDEIDAIFGAHSERTEPLRAILNAGNRPDFTIPRCVGDGSNQRVVDFSVYCPKALAGINTGRLPDTITDRSIRLSLKRKTRGETVERFRPRHVEPTAKRLCAALAAWAHDAMPRLAAADPVLPDELDDRASDAWEALFAIADDASGDWPKRARKSAKRLSGDESSDDDSTAVAVLAAVRDVFVANGTDRLPTNTILDALNVKDSPFAGWNNGKGINARDLAYRLAPFGVEPDVMRMGETTARGYLRSDLTDPWTRYLRDLSVTPVTTAAQSQIPGVSIRNKTADVADSEEAANPHSRANVADVADESRENGTREGGDDLLDALNATLARLHDERHDDPEGSTA